MTLNSHAEIEKTKNVSRQVFLEETEDKLLCYCWEQDGDYPHKPAVQKLVLSAQC